MTLAKAVVTGIVYKTPKTGFTSNNVAVSSFVLNIGTNDELLVMSFFNSYKSNYTEAFSATSMNIVLKMLSFNLNCLLNSATLSAGRAKIVVAKKPSLKFWIS